MASKKIMKEVVDEEKIVDGEMVDRYIPDKTKMTFNIETPRGIFRLKKPIGRFGILHYKIMTSYAPININTESEISQADMIKIGNGFEEWAKQILPHIIIDSPVPYDEMLGEDMYACYSAVIEMMSTDGELFRYVE